MNTIDDKFGFRVLQMINAVDKYDIKTLVGIKVLSLHYLTLQRIFDSVGAKTVLTHEEKLRCIKTSISGLDSMYMHNSILGSAFEKYDGKYVLIDNDKRVQKLDKLSEEEKKDLDEALKFKKEFLEARGYKLEEFGIYEREVRDFSVKKEPDALTALDVHNSYVYGAREMFLDYDSNSNLAGLVTSVYTKLYDSHIYKKFELTKELEHKIAYKLATYDPKYSELGICCVSFKPDEVSIIYDDGGCQKRSVKEYVQLLCGNKKFTIVKDLLEVD